MPMPVKDLSGRVCGDLTVLRDSGERVPASGGVVWLCRCSCGVETRAASGDLQKWRPGRIMSCGCRHAEAGQANRIHGGARSKRTRTPEFRAWESMRRRAGPLGVCDRWSTSFAAFLGDLGPRPDGARLRRIDRSLPYEPGNVVWG